MMYHIKGFIARVLDIFDPDDYTYVVSDKQHSDKWVGDSYRNHVANIVNFKL